HHGGARPGLGHEPVRRLHGRRCGRADCARPDGAAEGLPQLRGGALGRCEPDEPEQHRRLLAAGSLVGRRVPRARGRREPERRRESTGNLITPERVPGDLSFKGAAMFTRTTDAGASWEPARVLYDPGAISQTIGNQLVVLPDGTLVAFFDEILGVRNSAGPGPFNLSLKRSFDKGVTWLPAGPPIRTNKLLPRGTVTPDDHRGI